MARRPGAIGLLELNDDCLLAIMEHLDVCTLAQLLALSGECEALVLHVWRQRYHRCLDVRQPDMQRLLHSFSGEALVRLLQRLLACATQLLNVDALMCAALRTLQRQRSRLRLANISKLTVINHGTRDWAGWHKIFELFPGLEALWLSDVPLPPPSVLRVCHSLRDLRLIHCTLEACTNMGSWHEQVGACLWQSWSLEVFSCLPDERVLDRRVASQWESLQRACLRHCAPTLRQIQLDVCGIKCLLPITDDSIGQLRHLQKLTIFSDLERAAQDERFDDVYEFVARLRYARSLPPLLRTLPRQAEVHVQRQADGVIEWQGRRTQRTYTAVRTYLWQWIGQAGPVNSSCCVHFNDANLREGYRLQKVKWGAGGCRRDNRPYWQNRLFIDVLEKPTNGDEQCWPQCDDFLLMEFDF